MLQSNFVDALKQRQSPSPHENLILLYFAFLRGSAQPPEHSHSLLHFLRHAKYSTQVTAFADYPYV